MGSTKYLIAGLLGGAGEAAAEIGETRQKEAVDQRKMEAERSYREGIARLENDFAVARQTAQNDFAVKQQAEQNAFAVAQANLAEERANARQNRADENAMARLNAEYEYKRSLPTSNSRAYSAVINSYTEEMKSLRADLEGGIIDADTYNKEMARVRTERDRVVAAATGGGGAATGGAGGAGGAGRWQSEDQFVEAAKARGGTEAEARAAWKEMNAGKAGPGAEKKQPGAETPAPAPAPGAAAEEPAKPAAPENEAPGPEEKPPALLRAKEIEKNPDSALPEIDAGKSVPARELRRLFAVDSGKPWEEASAEEKRGWVAANSEKVAAHAGSKDAMQGLLEAAATSTGVAFRKARRESARDDVQVEATKEFARVTGGPAFRDPEGFKKFFDRWLEHNPEKKRIWMGE